MNEIKTDKNKFYIGESPDNIIAELTFYPANNSEIIVNHTYVSPSLRGQGIGLKLVDKAVEYARKENLKIIPQCSFVKKIMTEDSKYHDMLVKY